MNDLELVKVGHTRHDLGELKDVCRYEKQTAWKQRILTKPKRFASGFDLAYCTTFPPGIHSVRMWKQHGSVETVIPNKGKMFGWDKCFQ